MNRLIYSVKICYTRSLHKLNDVECFHCCCHYFYNVRIYKLAVNLQGTEAFKEIALVSLVFLDSSCHLLRQGFTV